MRTKFIPVTSQAVALAPEDYNGSAVADIPLDAVRQAIKAVLQAKNI